MYLCHLDYKCTMKQRNDRGFPLNLANSQEHELSECWSKQIKQKQKK